MEKNLADFNHKIGLKQIFQFFLKEKEIPFFRK